MSDLVEQIRTKAQGTLDCPFWLQVAEEIEQLRAALRTEQEAHAQLQSRCFDGGGTHSSVFGEVERLRAVCKKAETVMMIVEPRSHKAEYLAALAELRAALQDKG